MCRSDNRKDSLVVRISDPRERRDDTDDDANIGEHANHQYGVVVDIVVHEYVNHLVQDSLASR